MAANKVAFNSTSGERNIYWNILKLSERRLTQTWRKVDAVSVTSRNYVFPYLIPFFADTANLKSVKLMVELTPRDLFRKVVVYIKFKYIFRRTKIFLSITCLPVSWSITLKRMSLLRQHRLQRKQRLKDLGPCKMRIVRYSAKIWDSRQESIKLKYCLMLISCTMEYSIH